MEKGKRADTWWPGLEGAGDPAFVRAGTACLTRGGTPTLRAEALAGDVARALAAGVRADEALVVCADPAGAARMRARLEAAAAGNVPVMTCRELACAVIARPEACAATGTSFTGGRARILSPYETDFVVEDVKTLGTRPGRLRELLKFLYRGWSELSDEDPEWLFTVEELDTFSFLCDELRYLGAVMPQQVSGLAAKALRRDGALRQGFARRRVFVLDYQNLSRASQLFCQLVAGEDLRVYADAASSAAVHEDYPYPEGVADFARLNPATQVVELDARACGVQADEGGRPGACADPVRRVECVWDTPEAEVAGVAGQIADAVAAGCAPEDVAVLAPHPWWARRVARALEERGLPVNLWYAPPRLRGDIRELDRCLPLRAVTLLRLLADPHDGAAWRSWFGFGDYLARSNLFCAVRRGVPGGCDVHADLEAAGYDLRSDLDPLFSEARALRGPELLGHLVRTLGGPDAPVPAVLRPLLSLGLDADAAQMVAELDRRQFFDGLPARPGVAVSSYEGLAGLDFARVWVVGCVNGLFPNAAYFDLTRVSVSKQKKMGEEDARAARVMARMAREELHVSRFTCAEHAFAERVGLKQERIFAADTVDGGRGSGSMLAEASPSIYADILMGRMGNERTV